MLKHCKVGRFSLSEKSNDFKNVINNKTKLGSGLDSTVCVHINIRVGSCLIDANMGGCFKVTNGEERITLTMYIFCGRDASEKIKALLQLAYCV